MKRLLSHIFFHFVFFAPALAQPVKRFSFVHYGRESGLASNEVRDVLQDRKGYIWLGTSNGLQRFDGTRFVTFNHEKKKNSVLPGNYVYQVLLAQDNNLWLHLSDYQVGIFDTRKFTYRDVPIKPSNPVFLRTEKKIVEDQDGNILLVLANHELLIFNKEKNEFSPGNYLSRALKGWGIVELYPLPGTTKYIIGTQKGLVVYDKQTNQLSYQGHNLSNDPLVDRFGKLASPANFLLDKKGRLWFDTWEDGMPAIYLYDTKTGKLILEKHRVNTLVNSYHEVRGFLEQRNGTIWIKGLGIFAEYLEHEKHFRLVYNGYESEQSISYVNLNDFVEDKEGNIWVGTSNNGLYRFNPAQQFFTNIRHWNRISGKPGEGSIMSFMRTRKGEIYTGAWGDGLYRYDENFNLLKLEIKGMGENGTRSVWSMFQSLDSNIVWMGAQPGIIKVDISRRVSWTYDPPLLANRTVRQIAEDHYGNLWIGTQSIGIFNWDHEKGKKNFDDGIARFSDIPNCQVLKITIDRKGLVWVATSDQGVYVIDPAVKKIVMHLGTAEPPARKLISDGVASLLQYDDSTMVIGANGLHFFNNRRQKMTKTISLPASIPGTIASLEKDTQGYLWVSLTSGLCRVNPKSEIFVLFDRIDGIVNDNFIVAASYSLPDGRLLFGADNQLVHFDPSEVGINEPAPDVTITGFALMNQKLLVDSLLKLDRIELGPKNNSISIEFSGLRYNSANIIKYMLEGLDKEWKVADATNEAVYSYLPPGNYTFIAKSEDAEGRQGRNITKMVIRVKPPFWKTWWFLGLVILASVGVLYWLDKLRLQKLRAMESVRTRIATSLTEDMSSSLTNINISSELAKTKVDTDTGRTKEYIRQISETSNRMVQAMYDMVWSIDPKNDTMADTIERMKSFANEMETTYPINVEFDIDKKVEKLGLDMERRYEMLCIFKEALTNAAKHSDGRYIKVSLRYNRPKLMMMILDDGKGFMMDDAAMLGRGMSDMRRRAGAINAIFYVESEINTGTIVKLEMPV